MDNQQRSTLTYSVDHTVLESRVNAQRSFPCRDLEISYIYYDYKIKVEILNIQIIRSRAQIANGVGEIPSNRKGHSQHIMVEMKKWSNHLSRDRDVVDKNIGLIIRKIKVRNKRKWIININVNLYVCVDFYCKHVKNTSDFSHGMNWHTYVK